MHVHWQVQGNGAAIEADGAYSLLNRDVQGSCPRVVRALHRARNAQVYKGVVRETIRRCVHKVLIGDSLRRLT